MIKGRREYDLHYEAKDARSITVDPHHNEDYNGTMKITLLYQISRYIKVKNKEM